VEVEEVTDVAKVVVSPPSCYFRSQSSGVANVKIELEKLHRGLKALGNERRPVSCEQIVEHLIGRITDKNGIRIRDWPSC
jgi:hypothetical protein